MPDKHEVGGSSPLGPTNVETSEIRTRLKERKRLFSKQKLRDKLLIGGSSPLGPTSRETYKLCSLKTE